MDKGDEKTRKMNKVFRTMAFKFLREHFITYVFGNKKVKYSYNLIKYRTIFIKMLSYPDEFYALKIWRYILILFNYYCFIISHALIIILLITKLFYPMY